MEKPDYLSQNAHLRDVALEVAALIEECRGHEMHVELEGRIPGEYIVVVFPKYTTDAGIVSALVTCGRLV
jgi:hypothetical protein